ncbi:gluconate:proton symporter [Haloferula helveola]|uniref:Gluconate:proton symporter n=1 Tax=Haloferula helveola TaxID=490095 RepID=A0ABN6H2P4_9BACT|nr:gluconate:proton symporter [Haloferula helveola]
MTAVLLSDHPLIAVAGAIGLLLVLILWLRWQAFVALLVSSLVFAVAVGMPVDEIPASIVGGMGGALGLVATLVGLGAVFGAMLEHSGGARALANWMIRLTGPKGAPWALMVAGFLISIPVFLDTALVILCPLLFALARSQRKPAFYFGLPLLAGLAVTHSFVPPTPGPIIVAEYLGVSLGPVILAGIVCGLPGAILAGPLFAKWIVPRLKLGVPEPIEDEEEAPADRTMAWITLTLILAPIALILAASLADLKLGSENRGAWHAALAFVGHPIVALVLSTLASMAVMTFRMKANRQAIQEMATKALGPAGIIILVTGAGGVFKQILVDSGAGRKLAESMSALPIGYVALAWLLTAVIRVSQGSATVAMTAGAALMAPLVENADLSPMRLALLVAAIAAGATTASHVNDSGFWMISRYLQLTEKQTLKSWTVAETIISVVGLGMALLLWGFV